MPASPIRVLVVDDSATARVILARKLEEDPGVKVVGRAGDGIEALEQVARLHPDVVTLDVEMPRLDGLQTLERLMAEHPTPVVMVSSLTRRGAEATLRALELGAVDFIEKPTEGGVIAAALVQGLAERIRAAAGAKLAPEAASAGHTAPRPVVARTWRHTAVLIGSSTGGPQALREVICALPSDLGVPVVVVQHMPPGFTALLAARLDGLAAVHVSEARAGDRLEPGRVLVAPGGKHLLFDLHGEVRLGDGPTECGVRPSVNVAMESLLQVRGGDVLGVVLTGMGNDGTRGAGLIRQRGGDVIVESEKTALIYGMPRSVVEAGLASEVHPLHDIAGAIVARCLASSTAAA